MWLGGPGVGVAITMGLVSWLGVGGGSDGPAVDLALVLAVDVSSSMNAAEQAAQRHGYVAALRSREIAAAITSGPAGGVAIAYMEWAGPGHQVVRVPWAVVASAGEAADFATRLEAAPDAAGPATSISAALDATAGLLALAPPATRQAVDVSGDGPNNAGAPVVPARDRLIAGGATINGLAIALPRDGAKDMADGFGAGYVRAYYEDCVIGGPGAFVIVVDDASGFEQAILEKLVLEIAGTAPHAIPAGYRAPERSRVDCATAGMAAGR
jgi:hypothetical protein